ncbi:hypothetical protein M426DRAFT_316909 [Hypoxylon sp. CI-4A]|nr:hypothetical protein M426DRAFT_316909 [Hypoxylon sp. CI-4A]
MDKKLPAQQVQCRRDSWPLSNGEADQSGEIASEPKPTANNEAEQMAKIKAERRKGRIFSSDEIPRDLYEFPDPEIWSGKHGQNMGNDGHIWEDAGIDDPVATDDYAPQIIFTEPEDDDREAKESNRKPEDRLNVDMVYRVLYNKQTKELRDCKATLKSLARLVADAEEADLNDGPNLEKALKTIISDRAKLFDLMPLARIVADDQSLPFGDFKELPDALRRILADRDNAKKMAEYHKTTATRLWQRMASSEREHGE